MTMNLLFVFSLIKIAFSGLALQRLVKGRRTTIKDVDRRWKTATPPESVTAVNASIRVCEGHALGVYY